MQIQLIGLEEQLVSAFQEILKQLNSQQSDNGIPILRWYEKKFPI